MNTPEAVWYGSQGPQQLRPKGRRPIGFFGPFLSENQFNMVVRNNPHAHGLCHREKIAMLIGYARVSKAQKRAAKAG